MKTKITRSMAIVPLVLFAALTAVDVLVWRGQVKHENDILARHTQDVAYQSSRRLEIFLESHAMVAELFAARWVDHEGGDHSKRRFEEFGRLLIQEVSGIGSVLLVEGEGRRPWSVPEQAVIPDVIREASRKTLATSGIVVSRPFLSATRRPLFLVSLPLEDEERSLGRMIVVFDAGSLIDECFETSIRSEFDFVVEDGDTILYRHGAADGLDASRESRIHATRPVPVVNRTWRFTVMLRKEESSSSRWPASLSVLLLGLLLSAAISMLVLVLMRRIELFRTARDTALREIAERERTQSALDTSRGRYRSVFESATDGLIILDETGNTIEANPAACTMHGYEPGDLNGMSVEILLDPSSRRGYEEFKRQIEEHGSVHLESLNRRRDGSRLEVEVRGTDFRFGGEPRVLAVLSDVSAHKRAEERLAQLSRKVLVAQEEERQRLSRDLHDELGQLLTAQRLELDWLEKRMVSADGSAGEEFERAQKLVEESAMELRRICQGLRPPLLDDLGVEPAVRLLAEDFEERTTMRVDLAVQMLRDPVEVSRVVSLCVYRVLQESLTNISRHSGARNVEISLQCTSSELMLSVYDDGRGFMMDGGWEAGGSGITGMHERAHLVGGTIEVRSRPSEGTRIVLRVPLEEETP